MRPVLLGRGRLLILSDKVRKPPMDAPAGNLQMDASPENIGCEMFCLTV